ncbi:MAG: hypothetical protein JNJ54_35630 [Myxococcaceae bacterium]|nr:hypothetical protein [Myxococcaceae bacterium]
MGSGPLIALGGGLLSALAFSVFGYPLWLFAVLGALWLPPLVYVGIFGHRNFGTRANSDLMIAVTGLAITLAIAIPKAVQSQPCGQTRLVADRVVKAEERWRDANGRYVDDVKALEIESFPEVKIAITTDGGAWELAVTHPACLLQDGGVRVFTAP